MSYVSGFMMGAALGKSIRQMLAGNSRPAVRPAVRRSVGRAVQGVRQRVVPQSPLQLVSKLPGRRRYRVTDGMSPELAALLTSKLNQLSFLDQVTANAATGSILFVYDSVYEAKMDLLVKWLQARLFPPKSVRETVRDFADQEVARAGSLTRSVRSSACALSGQIKDLTGGVFDISSLASVMFLLRGLRKLVLTHQAPSGSQMLWWALTLMRGWRTV